MYKPRKNAPVVWEKRGRLELSAGGVGLTGSDFQKYRKTESGILAGLMGIWWKSDGQQW